LADVTAAPRSKRISLEAWAELSKLKATLILYGRAGWITAEAAKGYYMDAVAQIVNSGIGLVDARRDDNVVRCRSCFRIQVIPKQDSRDSAGWYHCACSHSEKRFIFVDAWDETTHRYTVDENAIVNKPNDDFSRQRAQDIEDGANEAEIAAIYGE